MNLWPYRSISSSGATIFGVPVYGRDHPKWSPIWPLHRLFLKVHNLKWAACHRWHPRHRYNIVKTDLEPGYYDEDTRMLHACMALLCQFVEWHGGAEKLDAFTDDLKGNPDLNAPDGINDRQINTQSEAVAIYRWWKVERPASHKHLEEWMMRLFSGELKTKPIELNGQTLHEIVFDRSEERDAECRRYWDYEEKLEQDDQQMLHRLIDIRRGLWT